MAKIKVRHFASKTIGVGNTVDWESMVMELFIAFLLGFFAYMGYSGGLALLLFPCAIGSLFCLLSFFQTVYLVVKQKHLEKSDL